jgi:hypothetical protein
MTAHETRKTGLMHLPGPSMNPTRCVKTGQTVLNPKDPVLLRACSSERLTATCWTVSALSVWSTKELTLCVGTSKNVSDSMSRSRTSRHCLLLHADDVSVC